MYSLHEETKNITNIVIEAAAKARRETSAEPEPNLTNQRMKWPIECTVGPGLEGAFACESKIGYVNGSKGWLIYRGYDIFDLCAYSTFEEVSYLLLHGNLPTRKQLEAFNKRLVEYRSVPNTIRMMLSFPVQDINTMAALRIGCMMMRQRLSFRDTEFRHPAPGIATDEDSIPMETLPTGEKKAIYEFKLSKHEKPKEARNTQDDAESLQSCYHLISGLASITAAIQRVRQVKLPVEPDPELSHAGNLIYMMTGKRPTPVQERMMDICLILHADHGMNASTFASMVVASTLSDIYFSIGAGIAALNGPLHGGANEQVLHVLNEIGDAKNVQPWYKKARAEKRKIMGFGHRVYKAYDPRARVLGPLAEYMSRQDKSIRPLFKTAKALEKEVVSTLGEEKGIFPNVDFYSGIVYSSMGIPTELFTPIFAVSRVSGWTARILEYLKNNRIFRPRSMYTGKFNCEYQAIDKRCKK